MQPKAWPAGLCLAPGNGVIMRKFLGLESEPMKLVILIPAYNEGEVIGQVINTLPKSLLGIAEIIPLVVDDGSKDNTAAVAADAGAMVVRHPYNHGLGKAFSTGLTKAWMSSGLNCPSASIFTSTSAPSSNALVKPVLNAFPRPWL